jgi:hypothetical protein
MKHIALSITVVLLALVVGAAGAVAIQRSQPAPALPASTSPVPDAASGADDASASGLLPDADWPANAPSPEQVIYAQHALMQRAIDRLRPRTTGKVNLYAVVFAGDGSERVFRNEAEYLARLLAQRFAAAGHVLVLENSPASLTTRPLATWSNLEATLAGVAKKMDPAQDILLVYLTTHGSEDHTLLVDMDPLPLDQIGADDLAGILAEQPFRHKVVIVNACYSGGFIPPLRGAGTMVITAARADRSSFGCGEQSELTWFGHALVVDALNRTADFRQAFSLAHGEVADWERRDRYQASDPQLWVGAGIVGQLQKWRAGFTPGPAVPFAPAPSAPPASR